MATDYIGAVKLCSFNFAPKGYAQCNGQLLPINQNQALFSVLGTTFGGNGTFNFALPNLQGRAPVGQGTGPGLSSFVMGQVGGVENVTLTQTTTPAHFHAFNASTSGGTTNSPSGHVLATLTDSGDVFYAPFAGGFTAALMPANTVSSFGGSQPHPNIQPTLCINYAIALQGIFPSQN